ncbi:response regulator transcription factor [Treponema sp.]
MSDNKRILLIEDEAGLVMTIVDRLEAEGYHCESLSDGRAGFEMAKNGPFDLILLDLMLPHKDGFEICRDLRAFGIQTPILMLTARNQILDKVLGLKLGADDYLCKPFDMAELLARIEALIRRSKETKTQGEFKEVPATASIKEWADAIARGKRKYDRFSVDFSTGIIVQGTEEFNLSGQEFKLLAYLTEHPDQIISRDTLLDAVWGYGSETTTRTVDVHVAWLRKKIGDTDQIPRHILTVRGLGYRFLP